MSQPNGEPTTDTTPAVELDGEFNEDRAKRLIENLRADKAKQAERLAAFEKAQRDAEEATKSELQKAIDRAARLEADLKERDAKQERETALKAALKAHGLTEDDADLLDGVAADKLDARAEALAKRLGKSKQDPEPPIPGKPQPRLTPGHRASGSGAESFDENAIADRIRSRGY